MEYPQEKPKEIKWPKRMALVCLLLFAVFWSLGPFFFWTLLLLSLYFILLHFYYSESVRKTLEGIFNSVRQPSQPPPNPYQAFRPRSGTTQPTQTPVRAGKVVRFVVLGFFFFTLFLFLVGLFTSVEESTDSGQGVSIDTETPTEDDGTTYWNEKGSAAMQNEKQDSALYYYNQALAIDPQNVYALYNTGLAYVLRQDYRKGNGFTRRCLQYHPEYDPAWWLLGYSYDLTNQTDSALYALEQAYGHDYSQPDFLQLLAEVYVKKDKRRMALEVYQKMVDLDTTRADIYRKMVELDPSNAEKYMQKVRALGN